MKRKTLGLTVSVEDTNHRKPSHGTSPELSSSISTISSLTSQDSTLRNTEPFMSSQDRDSQFKTHSLKESSERDSLYSQDSACVILTPKTRAHRVATPQTALTFAAIWDPDQGFTTISGRQLLHKSSQLSFSFIEPGDSKSDVFGNGHPECEPHLSSRFSTTTTSTSNYINVDFVSEETKSITRSKTPELLQPGDAHPPWLPQIFNVGYTKPRPSTPLRSQSSRPVISEPFQLTSALFSRKPTARASSRNLFQSRPSTADSSTSLKSHTSLPRLPRALTMPQTTRVSVTPPPMPRSSSPESPSTPTSRRPRLPSVFGRIKRTNPQNDGWVFIDITPRMRVVYLDD
ncbi:hypothetical protein VNI00_010451 [Paramarasmius palmivorus]|uniref:Uncharacterized protein n=1 Tax=Paramarasmius palmivorus TaxID=297713 RepID=A0AAW0CKN4_9AGAR